MAGDEKPLSWFSLDIQGPFDPKATLIGEPGSYGNFVAVTIAGDEESDSSADVFVTSLEEADAFIEAFTEARRLLARGEVPGQQKLGDA